MQLFSFAGIERQVRPFTKWTLVSAMDGLAAASRVNYVSQTFEKRHISTNLRPGASALCVFQGSISE
jgi:hypothetical protein